MVSYPYLNPMQELLNQLAFSLTQKKELKDCTPGELKAITEKYPYYSIAQLLYVARLKQVDEDAYAGEIQKTSLYFNNPLWLNFLLSNREPAILEPCDETKKAEIQYEDFNNDELVVENPIREFRSGQLHLKEEIITAPAPEQQKKDELSFVFEPYHTVDYFASQGIKPVQEEKPKDRFGQQLKSFTEWLKTLKTTPAQEIATLTDARAEEKVIHLADHSIEYSSVETEAMAAVWIKQGQPEKAVVIYQKLSLLNPSKSSYFAGLIENLKHK